MILKRLNSLLILLLWASTIYAIPVSENSSKPNIGVDVKKAEPLLLVLQVKQQLRFDLDGYLYKKALYLPFTQLLSILKLPYTYRKKQHQIEVSYSGFDQTIHINFKQRQVDGAVEDINTTNEDFIITKNEIYVRTEWLERVFGLNLFFNYRKLLVTLTSEKELPVLKYHRRQHRYRVFRGENTSTVIPDVIQPAGHHLFTGWVADWSVNSSHNQRYQNYSYGLSLGGHLLGGSLTMHANGSKNYGPGWDQIRGQWKFPFYSSMLQQLVVGDQTRQNVLGGTYLSYRGVSITNSPKAPRSIFDDAYGISYPVRNGWDGELYVNNRLSDVVTGARQDSLSAHFPLKYGSNLLALNYYNPNGLSYNHKYQIYIPRNFLPRGKVEYHLSAGRYRNFDDQLFAQAELNWGLSSRMTLGGGIHYIPETSQQEQLVPFMQTWLRLGNRLILEGSHAYKLFTRGALRYTFQNMRTLRLSFKKYHKASVYNKLQKQTEVSANTSIPLLKLPFLNLSSYVSGRYTEHQSGHFVNIYGGISASLPLRMRLRVHSRISLQDKHLRSLELTRRTTDIKLSKRLLRHFLLRPSVRFDHVQNRVMHSQLEVSRRVFKNGYLSLFARRDHRHKRNSFFIRFTLNLPFARHSSYVNMADAQPTYNQSTSGTIAFDNWDKLHTDDRSWINKSAARIDPFLDLNNNARKDDDEPQVEGVEANYYTIKGNRPPIRQSRQVAKYLTPYEPYMVEINSSSIDNPLWIPKHKYYKVQVSPNMVNKIPVPILPSGELSGSVQMQGENSFSNLDNLTLYLSGSDHTIRDTLITYSEGSFFDIGLKPGHYTVALDRQQLAERSLTAVKDSAEFYIESRRDGDIVDGVRLKVASNEFIDLKQAQQLDKVYTIQIGAFKKRSNAASILKKTRKLSDNIESRIVFNPDDAFYRCHIGLFTTEEAARKYLDFLISVNPDRYSPAYIVEMNTDQLSDFSDPNDNQ